MSNRYLFNPLERLGAGCNVMHSVEDFGAVVSNPAVIANSHYNAFENYEAFLVLERFPSNFLRANDALAVLALITVRTLFSALRGFHKQ